MQLLTSFAFYLQRYIAGMQLNPFSVAASGPHDYWSARPCLFLKGKSVLGCHPKY